MRFLLRPLLSVSVFLLLLGLIYVLLPQLLTGLLRAELERRDFTVQALEIGTISGREAVIKTLQLASDGYLVDARGLSAHYRFADLMDGTVDTIEINRLDIMPVKQDAASFHLPRAGGVAELVKLSWHDLLPARRVQVYGLSLHDENRTRRVDIRGEINRQATALTAEFTLRSPDQREYLLRMNTTPARELKLELSPVGGSDNPALSIELSALETETGVQGQLVTDLGRLGELAGIASSRSGALTTDFRLKEIPDTEDQQLTVEAKGTGLDLAGTGLELFSLTLDAKVRQAESGYEVLFFGPSGLQAQGLQSGANRVGRINLQFPESVRIETTGVLTVEAPSRASLGLTDLVLDGVAARELQANELSLKLGAFDTEQPACGFATRITLSPMQLDSATASLEPLYLQGLCASTAPLRWQLRFDGQQLAYEDSNVRLSAGECVGSFGNLGENGPLNDDPLELGGSLDCLSSSLGSELNAKLHLNPINGAGRADFSLPAISPDESRPLIASVARNWSEPFEIVAGDLSVNAVYRWWKNSRNLTRTRMLADIELRDGGGHYETVLFSGLALRGSIELLPTVKTTEPMEISIATLDAGMPVLNSSLTLGLETSGVGNLPVATIDALRVPLFDGELQGDDLRFDLNRQAHEVRLALRGLDLARIVELQQIKGLLATGILDGEVPIAITPSGLSVSQGNLNARKPGGRIQYRPAGSEAIEQSAPGSDLVLDILEDLQYESLEIDLDYAEDGAMVMQLAIRGMSPQVDRERPVHLNLRLEQNLLKLLQQLRFTLGISDKIDRNIQNYFSSQTGIAE